MTAMSVKPQLGFSSLCGGVVELKWPATPKPCRSPPLQILNPQTVDVAREGFFAALQSAGPPVYPSCHAACGTPTQWCESPKR